MALACATTLPIAFGRVLSPSLMIACFLACLITGLNASRSYYGWQPSFDHR
jgi:hypothetical protein